SLPISISARSLHDALPISNARGLGSGLYHRLSVRPEQRGQSAREPSGAPQVADAGVRVAEDLDRIGEPGRLGVDLLESFLFLRHDPIVPPPPSTDAGGRCRHARCYVNFYSDRLLLWGVGRADAWWRSPSARISSGPRAGSARPAGPRWLRGASRERCTRTVRPRLAPPRRVPGTPPRRGSARAHVDRSPLRRSPAGAHR